MGEHREYTAGLEIGSRLAKVGRAYGGAKATDKSCFQKRFSASFSQQPSQLPPLSAGVNSKLSGGGQLENIGNTELGTRVRGTASEQTNGVLLILLCRNTRANSHSGPRSFSRQPAGRSRNRDYSGRTGTGSTTIPSNGETSPFTGGKV